MILGADAIRAALASGAIVCDPAPAAVEGAHIDVRLGRHTWVWAVQPSDILRGHAILIGGADPRDCFEAYDNGDLVAVPPRGFILAHTVEAIGTAPGSGLLPTLHTRSTLARWGLGCHPAAGWGDPGFVGPWTLEIINPHPVAVAIPVGARVGCIAFERVEGETVDYGTNARYNYDRATWNPSHMLPRPGNW